MSFFGTPAADALAGRVQNDRLSARAKRTREDEKKQAAVRDPVDVSDIATEAIRQLKDNTQEDAAEDHREHPAYGQPAPKQQRHIDTEA
ncbi:MAG: hypothetical protein AAF747_03120 [Planctomycetota bacterium]